jgi:hypothetical protein
MIGIACAGLSDVHDRMSCIRACSICLMSCTHCSSVWVRAIPGISITCAGICHAYVLIAYAVCVAVLCCCAHRISVWVRAVPMASLVLVSIKHLHYKHMRSVWHTLHQGMGESYLGLASLALVSVMHMRLDHMLSVLHTPHQCVDEPHPPSRTEMVRVRLIGQRSLVKAIRNCGRLSVSYRCHHPAWSEFVSLLLSSPPLPLPPSPPPGPHRPEG